MEKEMDSMENTRPYFPASLSPASRVERAGNIKPCAMPMKNSETGNGTGQERAMPKKITAMPKLPPAVRRKDDVRFKKSMLKVNNAPILTTEKRMPELRIDFCEISIRGSSKNKMPCEHESAKGIPYISHGMLAAVDSAVRLFVVRAVSGVPIPENCGEGISLIPIRAKRPVPIKIQPSMVKEAEKPSFATIKAPAAGETIDAKVWTTPLPAISLP